jgi:acyl carrier protein
MTTFEKVREIIAEQLGVSEGDVKLETTFGGDLGCDSLDNVELVMTFEEEFDIEIPDCDDDLFNKTVQDAVNYIEKECSK